MTKQSESRCRRCRWSPRDCVPASPLGPVWLEWGSAAAPRGTVWEPLRRRRWSLRDRVPASLQGRVGLAWGLRGARVWPRDARRLPREEWVCEHTGSAAAFGRLVSLYHSWLFSQCFKLFLAVFVMISVISGLWGYCCNCLGCYTPHLYETTNNQKCCFSLLRWPAVLPSLSRALGIPLPGDTTVLNSGRESPHQSPYVSNRQEEVRASQSKSKPRNDCTQWGRHFERQDRPRAGPLAPNSQAGDGKDRSLEEWKVLLQWVIRKGSSLTAGVQRESLRGLDRRSDRQASFSHSLAQSETLAPFSSGTADRWGRCGRKGWSLAEVDHEVWGETPS